MQADWSRHWTFKNIPGLVDETYKSGGNRPDLKRVNGVAIDRWSSNLYPFAQTIAKPG